MEELNKCEVNKLWLTTDHNIKTTSVYNIILLELQDYKNYD